MGFLKRLFSIGGKKHNKSKAPKTTDDISGPMPKKRGSTYHTVAGAPYSSSTPALQEMPNEEEDPEVAVHRLLRSSSARYAVAHEVDHSEIPPMPHPINEVLSAYNAQPLQAQTTGFTLHPSVSTASIASSTLSTRGGSYNVKVYTKQRLSSGPEEVLANELSEKKKDSDTTHLNANDSSRMLKLRSEPSIVSLVSLYDDQGRLPDEIFNNNNASNDSDVQPTPRPRKVLRMPVQEQENPVGEGRAQCKRSGSTLRQLLGASTNGKPEDTSEGDISWAERFLGEVDGLETDNSTNSARSSFALPTPDSAHGHTMADVSIMTNATIDNPTISSMDVEVSISTTASHIFEDDDAPFDDHQRTPSRDVGLVDPAKTPTNKPHGLIYKGSIGPGGNTPQKRASQVFGFIKKRASKFVEKDQRDLAEPPNHSSTPPSAAANRKRRSSGSSREEREVTSQLMISRVESGSSSESAFSKRSSGIPVFAGVTSTPTRPKASKPPSERIDAGGLESMSRMMMKRLSFNRGSRSSREEQQEEEQSEPEPRLSDSIPSPVNAAALHTPMRPSPESDKEKKERDVRVLMTGPTNIIVTAPTPGHQAPQTGISLSRIPRGPRGPPHSRRRRTSGSEREERRRQRYERAERENVRRERADREKEKEREKERERERYKHQGPVDPTMISTPRKKVSTRNFSHQSHSSVSSVGSGSNENTHPNYGAVYAEAKRFVEAGDRHLAYGYANAYAATSGGKVSGGLGVRSEIPMTPLRTSKRSSVNQDTFQPPAHARSGSRNSAVMWGGQEEGREERRRPKGERALYGVPGSRSGGSSARQYRV